MIDLHFWPTPNGLKISIFLEEAGLPYKVIPVNIGRGEQFKPEFLAISPNNRMPAIVDHAPADGGAPISVFESGAILIYLADKIGRFIPPASNTRARVEVLEWVMWQMGNFGPMAGQANHFKNYAPEKIPYAIERYTKEVDRLMGVVDRRVTKHEYLGGAEYSIADMMAWPWAGGWDRIGLSADPYPHFRAWYERVGARPGVQRGKAVGGELRSAGLDDQAKKVLFGQTAQSVRDAEKEKS